MAAHTSSPDMTFFFLLPFFLSMAASTTEPKLSNLDEEGRLLPGGPFKKVSVDERSVRVGYVVSYHTLTNLEKSSSEGAGGTGRFLVVLVGVEQFRGNRNC